MSDRDTDVDLADGDELAELRALARQVGIDAEHPLEPIPEPPPGLFDRISAELAVDVVPPGVPARTGAPAGTDAEVVPLRGRAPRWLAPLAAAAAVLVVVGFVVVSGDDADQADVLATVTLDQLGDAGAGTAELVDADGQLQLRLDTSDLDAGDGFLEVWVIDRDVTKLVSLGPLRSDGTYDLPPGIDPADFPVVDVSVEPLDGNPAHSGDSVLRGTLDA